MTSPEQTFDAFLCHNSKDKPLVRELKRALEARSIKAWLDEEQVPPGMPFLPALEAAIGSISSALVLVGPNGYGPWHQAEIEALIRGFIKRQRPVIPTFLPGAPHDVELPVFLQGHVWVDFKDGFHEKGILGLVWGITGRRPGSSGAVDTDDPAEDRESSDDQPDGWSAEEALRSARQVILDALETGDLLIEVERDESFRKLARKVGTKAAGAAGAADVLLATPLGESLLVLVRVRRQRVKKCLDRPRLLDELLALRDIALALLPLGVDPGSVVRTKDRLRRLGAGRARQHLIVDLPTPTWTVAEGIMAAAEGRAADLVPIEQDLPRGDCMRGVLKPGSRMDVSLSGVEHGIGSLASAMKEHLIKELDLALLAGDPDKAISESLGSKGGPHGAGRWYCIFFPVDGDAEAQAWYRERIQQVQGRFPEFPIIELRGHSIQGHYSMSTHLKELVTIDPEAPR